MKSILAFVIFVGVFAAAANSQSTTSPVPTAPQPVNTEPVQVDNSPLNCASGADLLVFTDWESGAIREACLETSGRVRQRVITGGLMSVVQVQHIDRNRFYALSQGGRLSRIGLDPNTRRVNSWEQWRVPGGGFISLSDSYPGQVILTLPWESERLALWLHDGGGNYYSSLLYDYVPASSRTAALTTSGNLLYLDVRSNQVWAAKNVLFGGPDYAKAQPVIPAGKSIPVGLVAKGDTGYVLSSNQYEYPETPVVGPATQFKVVPGSLQSVQMDFDGNLAVETVVPDLDIDADVNQRRIAVSDTAIYFVTGAPTSRGRANQIVKYDLVSKKVSVFLPANDPGFADFRPFLTGLAVAPKPAMVNSNAVSSPVAVSQP